MGEYKCEYCIELLHSVKAHARHLALEHDAYFSGELVSLAVINSLLEKEDRVLFLLRKYKETRNPNNWQLDKQYAKWFSPNHLIVWDDATKKYMQNPREGWTEQQVMMLYVENATIERSRRKLQARDKVQYHDSEGRARIQHRCILPTEEAQAIANVSQVAHREYYGSGRVIDNSIGNTYLPDSQGLE